MPNVTIEDLRKLEGPLYRGEYPTVRGRVLEQIIGDTVFAAYAYKAENDNTPAHDRIEDLEATAMPTKDGIDSSFEDEIILPETAGKKPRKNLLFDILAHEDVPEEDTEKLVNAIKDRAVQAQIQRLVKRNMGFGTGGSRGISQRVAAGLLQLEEQDESWDEAFITRAVEFVVQYTNIVRGDDANNLAYLKGILEGGAPLPAPTEVKFAI